jgi:activator of HSP90 ATPase
MTTRRRFCIRLLATPALGLAVLDSPDDGISRAAESIHQTVTLAAAPARVYQALLDGKQFAAITGGLAAEIDPREGGAFSLFGQQITGRTIQLVPNVRIVQAWRSGGWKLGEYSIARFELVADGGGTKIVFDHTGFPVGQADHLADGWKSHYWVALQRL